MLLWLEINTLKNNFVFSKIDNGKLVSITKKKSISNAGNFVTKKIKFFFVLFLYKKLILNVILMQVICFCSIIIVVCWLSHTGSFCKFFLYLSNDLKNLKNRKSVKILSGFIYLFFFFVFKLALIA